MNESKLRVAHLGNAYVGMRGKVEVESYLQLILKMKERKRNRETKQETRTRRQGK